MDRASVEQQHRALPVHLGVEQDQAVDRVERKDVAALLRERRVLTYL